MGGDTLCQFYSARLFLRGFVFRPRRSIGGLDRLLRPKKKAPAENKPMTNSDRVGEGHGHDVDLSNQRELEGNDSSADQLAEKSQ